MDRNLYCMGRCHATTKHILTDEDNTHEHFVCSCCGHKQSRGKRVTLKDVIENLSDRRVIP